MKSKNRPKNKKEINSSKRSGYKFWIFGNALILLVVLIGAYLNSNYPQLYYKSLQEDEIFEWISFWGFFIAALLFGLNALNQYRSGIKIPWFSTGVAFFCFVFAMEEISWGQRLLGYRPPSYFLENNYQQELNVHNVFSKKLRILTLKAIMLGYGVLLPLSALIPGLRTLYKRLAISTPPVNLLPAFIATFLLYEIYPWKYSGELAELMLGFGFLFTSLLFIETDRKPWLAKSSVLIVIATLTVILLGTVNTAISRQQRNADPEIINAAKRETEALFRDFVALASAQYGFPPSRCGYHVRVFSYENKYDRKQKLGSGYFSRLTEIGLSDERAEFFLDPWNSPYWVRDQCLKDGSRIISVYSFGPDRKRQTLPTKIQGDDIGKLRIFRNPKRY